MKFYVYLVECLKNNKKYVGKTSNCPFKRFNNHYSEAKRNLYSNYFHNTLRKYDKSHFKVSVLEICSSEDLAYEKEKYWIENLKTLAPLGLNSTSGGKGGTFNPSEETRKKLSLAKKNYVPWNKNKIISIKRIFNMKSFWRESRENLLKIAKDFDRKILLWYIKNRVQ